MAGRPLVDTGGGVARPRWEGGGEGKEGRHPRPLGLGAVADEWTDPPGGRAWVGRPLAGLRAPGKIRVLRGMFVWRGNPPHDLLPSTKVIKEAKLPLTLACALDRVVDGKDRGGTGAQFYTHTHSILHSYYISMCTTLYAS